MQKQIFLDLLTYLPAKMLPALTALITVPIFTRLFSPDQYGNYILAYGVSEFLLAGTSTGFVASAVRFYTAYKLESSLPSYFAAMFVSVGGVTLSAAGIGAGLLVVFRSLIPSDFYPLLWAAIALFVVNAWFVTLMHVLRAQERSKWYTIFELFNRYGAIAFSLTLVLVFGMRVEGLLWGAFLALLIPVVLLGWLTTRGVAIRFAHLSLSDLKQMWRYAWPLTLGNIAFWGLRLADRYIIGLFRGSYEVGLYSVSYNISARSIELLIALILLVPGPIIMRMWEEQGREAAEETLTAISRVFFLLVIPAVVGLAMTAAPLVRLLADQRYFEGYRAVWLIAVSNMAFGLGQLGSYGVLLAKRTHLIAINQFVATGVSLILSFITVPVFGFMGAAASACLSFLLLASLQAVTSSRFLTWRWPLRSLQRTLAASAIMAVSIALIQAAVGFDTTASQAINVLLAIVIGALVYGVVLWILGEISPHRLLKLVSADSGAVAVPVSQD